jgi:guanylate kinase
MNLKSITMITSMHKHLNISLGDRKYLLALTGPSGVGKSTVSRLLASLFPEHVTLTKILTTRSPKKGDEGEYVHVTPEEMEALKEAGKLAAHTSIPSSSELRQYAYLREDIEGAWKSGKLPVIITEQILLQQLADTFGRRAVLSFGLLPPGKSRRAMLSHLLFRLRTRGRETEQQIADRLKNAHDDLAFFSARKDLFNHFLVNDDLEGVVGTLRTLVPHLAKA